MAKRTQITQSEDAIEAIYVAAPGTEILMDEEGSGATERRLNKLQHAKTGDGHIILVPQPSTENLNDPLLWSQFKKWSVLTNGVAYAFNGAVTGPMMAGGMIQLAEEFGVSLTYMSYANGATLICQGFGNLLWMPFSIKYGRRPVYLASNLLMGIACIWLAVCAEKTYIPFIIGRAFLGLFEAPIEAIVPSTVTDIFYLHERGEKISVYGLGVLGGNSIGPLVSAYIIQSLSVRWAFFVIAIAIFINQLTLIFYMPETKFLGKRPQILPPGVSEETLEKSETQYIENAISDGCGTGDETGDTDLHSVIPKRSYLQNLSIFSHPDPTINLRKTFFRPFVLMAYPTVIWSSVIYGLSLGWNVILGASVAQLFAPPPYLFRSGAQGLIFISPFLGSLVGTYLCGPFADRIANWATKRNHGVREPEMRLPACAIAATFTFAGVLLSSLTYHAKTHWAGPIVGFGVLSVGAQMGATLAMAYSLDCHKELSGELMVTISCLKSLIAWIWTWVINDWIAKDGLMIVFMTVATVNTVAYLSTILFYFKGKSLRIWIHRANLFEKAVVK
ncbi:major facilitator superfamily domain-containing protein [Amylocarpus encephaloides]|uniref:Major facilitator superfamily domain-containing protein n=1 Tax=Amylocarpus encephaloides TaxID=45428 RepID=A0A9P7YK40_9HELO|nr:major facilitator superfamily domain-containing protein [Amylocarpus encephaloides]